jgi:hypothetical protein
MKIFDSYSSKIARLQFSLELTGVPPFWNHPNTVVLYFAIGESLPNHIVF